MKENFQKINNIYPKTYGRKRGKKSKIKILNYKNHLKKYLINKIHNKKNIILEIGSGNGENVIKLSKLYPKKLIIACEVYIDGNASLISKLIKENITNVKLFEKNCFILLDKMKKNSVDEIWILYPDPWPKKRHHKRRLINSKFISLIKCILKKTGKIFISTDNKDYFINILLEFRNANFFWDNDSPIKWSKPFNKMSQTAFLLKAQKNSQKSNFMVFSRKI
tara:strand:- start:199 stop:864 length:666 start_codon:yes stop_codon:yes gene_type:complete